MGRYITTGLLFLLLTSGCLCYGPTSEVTLNEMQMPLTKVSKAVRGCLRHNPNAVSLPGDELLKVCVFPKNPALYGQVSSYQYFAIQEGSQVSVVLCDSEGRVALMEDLTCTPHVDRKYYLEKKTMPCRNYLKPNTDCPK